jgi:hypothetical protein
MELKDNFTNRYFKPDLVQKQVDMIKEPGATDALAEGFQRYGNLPANNAYAQLDNMTMAGVGDGMKATANDKRQEQLDPILKMTGQINVQNAYLEAQMQEQQEQTMQTQQFVKNQAFSFMELSKATAAGDTGASNNIARGILQSYKSSSGDPIIGDFDHYHDGNIYYTNAETGEKSALSIPLLLNQSEIAPELFGADYGNVMSSYSAGFKGQYENQQKMQRLAMEKEQAGIDQTKAHTGLYNAQAGKTTQEMNNPPMDKLKEGAVEDIYTSRAGDSFYKSAMKVAEDILTNAEATPDEYERNAFNRIFDREGKATTFNEKQEQLHAVGAEIKGAMFKRFKYRNQAEFENLPDISPNKTVKQNKAALQVIKDTYLAMKQEEDTIISDYTGTSSDDQNIATKPEFVRDADGNIFMIKD